MGSAVSGETAKQGGPSGAGDITSLRRLQAILLLPAVALVWMPGAILFYGVFLLLLISLIIEMLIQARIRPALPTIPEDVRRRRRG